MNDLEDLLRERLGTSLDGLELAPDAAAAAQRAGRRLKKRRVAVGLSGTAAVAAVAVTATLVLTGGGSSDARLSPAASARSQATAMYAHELLTDQDAPLRRAMSPTLREQLTTVILQSGWHPLRDRLGPVVTEGAPVDKGGDPDRWTVPVTLTHGAVTVNVSYEGGQIVGLTILSAGTTGLTDDAIRDAASTEIVNELSAHAFGAVTSRFDTVMTAALPASELGEAWNEEAEQRHGGFVAIEGIIATGSNDGEAVYRVTCTMRIGTMVVQIAYDPDGKIGGIYLLES